MVRAICEPLGFSEIRKLSTTYVQNFGDIFDLLLGILVGDTPLTYTGYTLHDCYFANLPYAYLMYSEGALSATEHLSGEP